TATARRPDCRAATGRPRPPGRRTSPAARSTALLSRRRTGTGCCRQAAAGSGSRATARSSPRPPDGPAGSADQTEQHDHGVAVEVTGLKPGGDFVANADGISRAVRAEAVDRAFVALLPEQAAEPHRRADEDRVVQLVEIPFVR